MNTAEVLQHVEKLNADGLSIMEAKNHDYAGESGDTPFRNFEIVEALGICSTETGMLVRMADKFARVVNFVNSGILKVKDESRQDTVIDFRNYLALFDAFCESRKELS